MTASAVLRRRLGVEMRDLRLAADLPQGIVARRLEMSIRTIQRMEAGDTAVAVRDLRQMLAAYGADPDTRDRLIDLGKQARQRGWWSPYRRLYPGPYIELEAGASWVRTYESSVVPGLLQTDEWMRYAFAALPTPPVDVDTHVDVRMRRQERVRTGELTLDALIDESVLHRIGEGDGEIGRRQLVYLAEACHWPNVSVRVVPFSTGTHAGTGTPFTILRFPDPVDADIVMSETLAWERYFDDAREVAVYNAIFDAMDEIATNPDDTKTQLDEQLKKLIP